MANKKEKILKRLKEHWNYAVECGYNESNFIGIFAYGSMNYGFYDENNRSDIDSKIILLPSFSDFCLTNEMTSIVLDFQDEKVELKDIRLMRNMFMKQNINFVELLYTEYFILNPVYENLFVSYFISNRDIIAHYDELKTLKSVGGQLIHILRQDSKDSKKLYNAYRLNHFLDSYVHGIDYQKCIRPDEDSYIYDILWKIKNGEIPPEEIDPNDLENQVNNLINKYSKELKSPLHDKAQKILDEGVIEIVKHSFKELKVTTEETISRKDFLKQLTHAEERAYYAIVKKIHEEGTVIISNLIKETPHSRAVYNNLINKMKEHKVAEITNMGVKGIHINITQIELRNEAMSI